MNTQLLHEHLYRWYREHKRALPWRETRDGYKIWLSEVILQQTRVAQGMEYYLRFVSRWPRVEDLAAASEEEVLREWQGLGYYSRARNLHKAAQMVVGAAPADQKKHGEVPDNQKKHGEVPADQKKHGEVVFPQTWEELRKLPGIGDYTAGAIASFAYNLPYPAMDGNVYRVVARLTDTDEAFDTQAGKKLFHRLIDQLLDRENAREFNNAIMEFGALQCTPSLRTEETGECACDHCPLEAMCLGHLHGTAEVLPVRKPRPKLRNRYLHYTIYLQPREDGIYTLIHQRTDKDIWQHLWEFPLEETDEPKQLKDEHTGSKQLRNKHIELKHTLSHQQLYAQFSVVETKELPCIEGCKAIRWDEIDDYALSRLTLKALEKLGIKPGK